MDKTLFQGNTEIHKEVVVGFGKSGPRGENGTQSKHMMPEGVIIAT